MTDRTEQLHAELAAVDASLGEFYCPTRDPETDEPCGSFYRDHGVHLATEEIEHLHDELDQLWGENGSHESGDECIACHRLATAESFPFCDQCLLETQLSYACDEVGFLRDELTKAEATIEQLQARITYLINNGEF